MRKGMFALSLISALSMLVLGGCKGDEPASEESEVQQPKQSEQPKQVEDKAAAEQAAIEAAEAWLKILDAAQYAKAMEEAAEYLRNSVAKEQWEQFLMMPRARCGKLVSRKLLSKEYTTEIPNAPAGQYVTIHYQTRFQNRTAAVETITPMLEKDGKWRVSGYYIK
ncbi:MAG TPA: DUF4019 domain-containing protein [Sedimentisphaerales bacterium]|nr:DUF4019 domain-containing protein [Sedimentisphaerales bacterium]